MPQYCPKCGALQPDGPRCQNCGHKFESPIQTSQGTWTTSSQLRAAVLMIVGIVLLLMLCFGGLVAAIVFF